MKTVMFRKVGVKKLLGLLTELYDQGLDYVDLCGKMSKNDEEADSLVIVAKDEYLAPEDELEIVEEEEIPIKKFDINNLNSII